jgi:site-specific recombinase XerD
VRFFFEIPRPKKRIILPNVLAIGQVERLFAQLENLKHKTMLYLAYSAGLRVSEVVNMKVCDIHCERMMINIKDAKGKKYRSIIGRYFGASSTVLYDLQTKVLVI